MNEWPIIRPIRMAVKKAMEAVADGLYRVTKGKLSANTVTWVSVLAHIPIVWLIIVGQFWLAAILLVIFGLFDAVDGALARRSGTAGTSGMVLDAFTDRIKETLMHAGAAGFLALSDKPILAIIPLVALGFSLSTNFLKAKAEVAYSVQHDGKVDHHTLNKMFSDGALSFEVRTFVFVVGILLAYLGPVWLAVVEVFIAIGVWQAPWDMKKLMSAVKTRRG